jgi:hypothetical protein
MVARPFICCGQLEVQQELVETQRQALLDSWCFTYPLGTVASCWAGIPVPLLCSAELATFLFEKARFPRQFE